MSIDLNPITSGYNLSAINDNFQKIETYINDKLLARNTTIPGEAKMDRDLDMDGHDILNAYIQGFDLNNITSELQRALRVSQSEAPIDPLVPVEQRKGMVLGFSPIDGKPAVYIPASGSAADVLMQLAGPTGYTLIPSMDTHIFKEMHDVRGWGEGEAGFNAAMAEMSAAGGGTLVVNEDILFTSLPVQHLPKVSVHWNARAIVQTGLSATYAYIMDGGADTPVYDNTDHFTLANKTNCYGLRLEAQDYTVGIDAIGVRVQHCYGYTFEGGAIIGFNKGGFEDEFCYEGKASKFTMVVSNARDDQSIGLHIKCTDGWYSEISPVGYAYGGKVIKSGNSLDKFHPWGNTVDGLVGAMGKMHVGLWVIDNGGFTSYSNLILDTPVRRNTSNVPSRTNGGVGLICDAWDTSFTDVLIAASRNDTPQKSTLPMITTSQGASFHNFSVSNPDYATDIWVSFESNSGLARNHFSGYGYAEKMRTGMTIGPNSGAALAPATNVSLGSQSLSSGIWLNTLTYSISTTVSATASATTDVTVNLSPIYGIKKGFGGTVKGGMFAFFFATANTAKQLYDVSIEVTADNTAKFLLTFIDGATRYARWTDVSSGSARSISLAGKLEIQ